MGSHKSIDPSFHILEATDRSASPVRFPHDVLFIFETVNRTEFIHTHTLSIDSLQNPPYRHSSIHCSFATETTER